MNFVQKVNNLNKKSFKNYTGPDELFNPYKNIIFGYNGKGKSSLAEGIVDEYKKINGDREDSDISNSYRYFNKDYISKYLLLSEQDVGSIKGVVAHFGKKAVEQKDIADLRSLIKDVSSEEEKRDSLGGEIVESIKAAFNDKKGKLRPKFGPRVDTYIQGMVFNKVIESLESDLDAAYNLDFPDSIDSIDYPDVVLILSTFTGDISTPLKNLDLIEVPEVTIISKDDFQILNDLLNETHGGDMVRRIEVDKWIKAGIELHKDEDKCQFCGSPINLDQIASNFNEYLQSQTQQAISKLEEYQGRINEILNFINKLISQRDNLFEFFPQEVDIWLNSLRGAGDYLNSLNDIISKKISNMASSSQVLDSDTFEKNMRSIVDTRKYILDGINDMKNHLNFEKRNEMILFKGAVASQVLGSCRDKFDEYESLRKYVDEARANNKTYSERIKAIEDSDSDYVDFADDMNRILKRLNVDLKLELNNDSYIVKHALEDIALTLDDISEGERNLLALLYFYCEMFDDKEKEKIKNDIELIIIDDPISSLDDTNKVFIFMLINEICQHCNYQVFVLTHSWENFSDIYSLTSGRYKNIDDPNNLILDKKTNKDGTTSIHEYKFWEIEKSTSGSNIVCLPNSKRNIASPYRHAFKQIYEAVSGGDENALSDDQVRSLPNSMRCVLEDFLSFKSGACSINIGNIGSIKDVLYYKDNKNVDKTSLTFLIEVCNAFSHKLDNNHHEVYTAAKFLMERIQAVDPQHYQKMTNQV